MKSCESSTDYGGMIIVVGRCQGTPDRHNAHICKHFNDFVIARDLRWKAK
jgi:hypothetical protein